VQPRVLPRDIAGHGERIVLVLGGLTGWLSWIPNQKWLARRYQAILVQSIHNELGSAARCRQRPLRGPGDSLARRLMVGR
jgi:hypothetical protein